MKMADKVRRLRVRANADQPDQCANAVACAPRASSLLPHGAHVLRRGEDQAMREMILAGNAARGGRRSRGCFRLPAADFEASSGRENGRP